MEQLQQPSRDQVIIRTSWIGIGANVLLAAFKAAVGLLSHSIAVVLDAVNNLSDALSSVITIVGTKLAAKAPDRKHPMGHGRVEYMSAIIIAVVVLYAGITSLVESVQGILHPTEPDYQPITLIIVGAAVLVKLLLGAYVRRKGEETHSEALIDSGTDARFDALLSAATLAAAAVYLIFHIKLEAWLGAVISIVLIRSGIQMLRTPISSLLGERMDSETSHAVRMTIANTPGVLGAYDLAFHDYGPDMQVGSVHVEVPESMTADGIDRLTREIQQRVLQEHGIIMAAIGIYAFNTKDPLAVEMRKKVFDIALSTPYVLQAHGFYIDHQSKELRFDIVVSFDAPDRRAVWADICGKVSACYPDWTVLVALDSDLSD